jgi:hypothetical protein
MENIKLFESKKIRSSWDSEQEKWYFSIVDIISALTDSNNPQVYWRVLKKRLLAEGNETVTNCNGLKMVAPDGKMRLTDVANTEQLFRLIQSIPYFSDFKSTELNLSFSFPDTSVFKSKNGFFLS